MVEFHDKTARDAAALRQERALADVAEARVGGAHGAAGGAEAEQQDESDGDGQEREARAEREVLKPLHRSLLDEEGRVTDQHCIRNLLTTTRDMNATYK